MRLLIQLASAIIATICLYSSCCGLEIEDELEDEENKWPTVGISILVKNKAHSLPFALTCLQQLDYPKDRIYVWFYMDGNVDESLAIVEAWNNKYKSLYRRIYVAGDKSKAAGDAEFAWTEARLRHVIELREKALSFARRQWADYIFMVDADVFLTEPSTLKRLVRRKLPVVAPMLLSDGLYSNFWGAMTDKYYYEKTEQYEKISNREVIGCFEVPMVHSAVLIDLRKRSSDRLTYDPAAIREYTGPVDDIIAFAISAKQNAIPMSVCNDKLYGFLPVPVDMNNTEITSEAEQLVNVKMEALSRGVELPLEPLLAEWVKYPARDRLGLARVFVINLKRRPERRRRMEASLRELGVEATFVDAVDGKTLDMKNLSAIGVTLMPKYEDPYYKRPMKAGEVGCSLSHYGVWKEIAARHVSHTLVLEDDVRFVPFFRRRFEALMEDLSTLDWEFVYIGRKILDDSAEEYVRRLVTRPRYSYWTLGYLVSEEGARRLIRAEPLARMLPVDELLPLMFDQHPNETWKAMFRRRELKAYSAAPLLISPTHYTGEEGYVSDTEDSPVLEPPEDEPNKPL